MSLGTPMRILLLTTGGTIAAQPGEKGLEPKLASGDILANVARFYPSISFSSRSLLNLDSSNIQPEEWQQMACAVYESLPDYDGVIVTHGTDTMAYTAAALSFMLRNLQKSVVLTGSQIPLEEPLSDAPANLHTAIAAIVNEIPGVSVAFAGRVINGTRAYKTSTMHMRAFESLNSPLSAEVYGDGLRVCSSLQRFADGKEPTTLDDALCPDVLLIKLLPGTKPELLRAVPRLGYRGVLIEAFGAGGIHNIRRDLITAVKELTDADIPVAVRSQCIHERVDLTIYGAGARLLEAGVVPCADMTTEAAAVKMMWALPKAADGNVVKTVREIFATNYCGEVAL